jgi:hypothetical protein
LRSKGGPPQQGTCLTKRRRSGRLLMWLSWKIWKRLWKKRNGNV